MGKNTDPLYKQLHEALLREGSIPAKVLADSFWPTKYSLRNRLGRLNAVCSSLRLRHGVDVVHKKGIIYLGEGEAKSGTPTPNSNIFEQMIHDGLKGLARQYGDVGSLEKKISHLRGELDSSRKLADKLNKRINDLNEESNLLKQENLELKKNGSFLKNIFS